MQHWSVVQARISFLPRFQHLGEYEARCSAFTRRSGNGTDIMLKATRISPSRRFAAWSRSLHSFMNTYHMALCRRFKKD